MSLIKIGKTGDIRQNSSRLFIINGIEVAVFNINGNFFAINNKCPHRGMSLAGGHIQGKTVACGGHGWQFDLDTGNNPFVSVSMKKYNLKSEGQELFLEM